MRPTRRYTPLVINQVFQFTHPGRGATRVGATLLQQPRRFNSRTPGGVRHCGRGIPHRRVVVSIHAPREGCDMIYANILTYSYMFQFTHPGRGATPRFCVRYPVPKPFQFTHPGRGATRRRVPHDIRRWVSIHAPREGCDEAYNKVMNIMSGFNSRTPGGVRLSTFHCLLLSIKFQFTHPGRGATYYEDDFTPEQHVSIHAPREGCDLTS